ncbi:flagellar filament capping protein FliD [bacterium]|nr:flagellar filament capping protein FliD [bacterium]
MSISFSGLGSGLDTASWVEALVSVKQEKINVYQQDLAAIKVQKNTLTDVRSTFSSFRTALEKLTDKKFGGSFDLFGKNTATSSNEEIFTATASSSAVRQNYNIAIQKLASATKVTSNQPASATADDETKLAGVGVSTGKLTAYVNGEKNIIEITADTTIGDLKTAFQEIGATVTINDGIMEIKATAEEDNLVIGATNDTTNIVSVLGLEKDENGTYNSSNALFKASTSSKLTDENSGFNETITTGTFKIGDAEFTIDQNTTLSSLIYKINNTESAQVTAYWDDTTGKLNLTSKKEGASYVNIEAGSSNFTDVMGFTTTERDEEGNIVSSKMFTDNQILGDNAIFSINGTTMTSTSNTVTSDISRLEGVTLTLNRVTTEDDGEVTLKVTQNTKDLVDAVKSFVEGYNGTIEKINTVTASGADFQRESSLTSFKNTIRTYANSSNTSNGGAFNLLSQIGISTTKADGSNLSADTEALELDEEALLAALESDPESVEEILAGENGVLALMESSVETMLKATSGFFDVKQSTLDSDIKKYEDKISKQQNRVQTYRAQLEEKFKNMDLMISQMQQNYSSFLG